MRKICFLLAVLGLFSLVIWNPLSIAQEVGIMIGTTGTSSGHYAYWVAAGECIRKYAPGINPTVVETGGALDNANRILKKQLDLGLTNRFVAYECYYGKNKWEGKPNPQVRWLWTYGVGPLVFTVREDSGVKSMYDLTGKKFCAGAKGSGSEKLVEEVFQLLGIKPDYYQGDWSDASEAVANRQIVGYAKWSGGEEVGDAMITSLAAQHKLRFISFSQEDLKKITTAFPYVNIARHPPNVYKDQNYDIHSIGTAGGALTTSTNLSPDLAFRICQAILKGMPIQEQAYKGFKGVNPLKKTLETSPIPLHIGAIRMLKEIGVEAPQSLIPPEYK